MCKYFSQNFKWTFYEHSLKQILWPQFTTQISFEHFYYWTIPVNNGDIVHVGAQVRIATFLRNVWMRPVGWVGGRPTGGILPLGSATQAALKAPGHSRPNAVKDFVRNEALLGLLPDFCSSHLPLLCWACQQCDL